MAVTEGNTQKRHARHIKWSFIAVVVVASLTLAGFAWVLNDVNNLSHRTAKVSTNTAKLSIKTAQLSKRTNHLAQENTKRINEIQGSRVDSCKITYKGIRKVFKPFIPKHPQTQAQILALVKFNKVINDLIKGCEDQTKPGIKKGEDQQ